MKKSVILLTAMVSVSFVNAQKVSDKEVPATVKSAFQKQYPNVKKVKWEKEENNYDASFEIKEVDYSLLMDASGNVLETEAEIGVNTLPANVKEYVSKHFSGQKIKEASKITDAKGIVTYEAEVKDKDLIFDANGKFIKEIKD